MYNLIYKDKLDEGTLSNLWSSNHTPTSANPTLYSH